MKTCLSFLILLLITVSTAYALECRCGEQGVTLTVVKGCENWTDATECSGWESVAHVNGKDAKDLFADKTQLTAFDCTIQINCPSSAVSDAGTTVTEEKKEDSGFCAILNIE